MAPKLDEALESKVHELFHTHAAGDKRLQLDEMRRLAECLGAELGVDGQTAFGDIDMAFWRFDFSGDGALDEEEGLRLIKFLLHAFEEAQAPPKASQPRITRLKTKHLTLDYRLQKVLGQ